MNKRFFKQLFLIFELKNEVDLDDYKHISNLIKTTDHFIKNDFSQWVQDCKWVSENVR